MSDIDGKCWGMTTCMSTVMAGLFVITYLLTNVHVYPMWKVYI